MSKHIHKKKKKNPVVEEIDNEIKENSLNNVKLNIKTFPLTNKQKDFVKLAIHPDTKMIFVRGMAGTSKSYCAIYAALRLLSEGIHTSVKYVRTTAESGSKTMGLIPGCEKTKFMPFLLPLYDKLDEMLLPQQVDHLISNEIVEAMPINYLRGASFRDSVIIADEVQGFTIKELITLITRIGANTRYILAGDPDQSDIGNKSGFLTMYNLFNTPESVAKGIHCFEFFEEDIMRSEILKYIVSVFKKLPNQNNGNGKYQI
jgi:phosphate starvation-inducible PhoH-like protein